VATIYETEAIVYPHVEVSTSAIVRVRHIGAGPGQRVAVRIFDMLLELYPNHRSVELQWVKGHARLPGTSGQITSPEMPLAAGTVTDHFTSIPQTQGFGYVCTYNQKIA